MSASEFDEVLIAAHAAMVKGAADDLRAMNDVSALLANLGSSIPGGTFAHTSHTVGQAAGLHLKGALQLAEGLTSGLANAAKRYTLADEAAAALLRFK